jgi:hypothetical protein
MNESIFNVTKNLDITEKIVIKFNNINEIPVNALSGSAKEINLENNLFKKIGSNAFSSLPNLEILSLKNNSIESIDDFGLDLKSNGLHKTIYLNHNKLNATSFKEKTLPKLKNDTIFIHLEDNLIHSLTENIFKPFLVEKKHKIFLERNKFECNCSMRWVTEGPQSEHIYGVFCADKQKSIFDATPEELGCEEIATTLTTKLMTEPTTAKAITLTTPAKAITLTTPAKATTLTTPAKAITLTTPAKATTLPTTAKTEETTLPP